MDAVADDAQWTEVSLELTRLGQRREGKYLLPAREDARLPALLMDGHPDRRDDFVEGAGLWRRTGGS